MSTDWIRLKRKNWPDGSKERALGGKSALEALSKLLNKNLSAKQVQLETLNDEQLELWVASQIIKGMHNRGIKRAIRKAD